MPKPKKSKVVSLVSAYESGAESDENEEISDSEQEENESIKSESEKDENLSEKNDSGDKIALQLNEDQKSVDNNQVDSNRIEIEEANTNMSSTSNELRTIIKVNMDVNEPEPDNHYSKSNDDIVLENRSVFKIENGFPPGCELIQLPPAPKTSCSQELQNKIIQVAERMKPPYNYSINSDIEKKKIYRNPCIYEKLIESHGIDEYGSNFPNYISDLKSQGYMDYLQLDEAQRAEWEKKEKEKKDRTKIEMVSGTRKK